MRLLGHRVSLRLHRIAFTFRAVIDKITILISSHIAHYKYR